jgi:hypothetical protein
MSDATRLRVQAERCFRLARGPASARLAAELEELGRAFEQAARAVKARLLRRSAQQSTSVNQYYVEAGEMVETI